MNNEEIYQIIKRHFKKNVNEKGVIKHWDDLLGLTCKNQRNVAIGLDFGLTCIKHDNNYYRENIIEMGIAAIGRILAKHDDDLSVDIIMNMVINILEKFNKELENYVVDDSIDSEAEFVAEFADNYKLT